MLTARLNRGFHAAVSKRTARPKSLIAACLVLGGTLLIHRRDFFGQLNQRFAALVVDPRGELVDVLNLRLGLDWTWSLFHTGEAPA